jgi:glutamate synthase domain-containing protein 3
MDESLSASIPVLAVPEIREYPRINAELVRLLNAGHARVRLAGAAGQRLLVAGLTGSWDAVIEIEGSAGPELVAELDAPRLTVVCHGPAADGAARGLRAGKMVLRGGVGAAVGYTQKGGVVVVAGPAGPRAGLALQGGTLFLLGPAGRLAGERQTGGRIVAFADRLGPYAGWARAGGAFERLDPRADSEALESLHAELDAIWPGLAEHYP